MLTAPFGFFSTPGLVTANLQLHLDAGDAASYDGSSQTWEDLTVNGFDFFRGTDGTGEASDPTFNGVSGDKSSSEYFSFDGGDFFTVTAAFAGSIMRRAGRQDQPFTIEGWVFIPAGVNRMLFSTLTNTTDDAIGFNVSSTTDLKPGIRFFPLNSTTIATAAITADTWTQVAVVGRGDGGTGTHYKDGAANGTFAHDNLNWTTGDSTRTNPKIGSNVSATELLLSGSRIAIFRMYDRELTANEILRNFNANRDRFSI